MEFPLQVQSFVEGNVSIDFFLPDNTAVREAYQKGKIPFPYWSRVWPAARALAQFLLRHPECTRNKTVVELGAGLGLPSLVAARNAKAVLCTDYAADAVAIVQQSAATLGLHNFSAAVVDWQHLPTDMEADVLLLSDINYEPGAFGLLLKRIDAFLQKGTTVLLSTPQRLMAKEFVAPLLHTCSMQEEIVVEQAGEEVPVSVLVLAQQTGE